MNELVTRSTEELSVEELGGEIRMLTRQLKGTIVDYGIQIGYRLSIAKEKVQGESFADWVERETELSKSSAYRMMKLYEEYGEDQGSLFGVKNRFPTVGKLSISNALLLLAVPEEEREEFAEKVDAEHLSRDELSKAIRERDEAKAAERDARCMIEGLNVELEELRRQNDDAKDELIRAAEEIDKLESRPVELAVDEEAVEKARKEAEAEGEKKLAALAEEKSKELSGIQANLRAAEQETRIAREEAEKKLKAAAEETEALREKLRAAVVDAGSAEDIKALREELAKVRRQAQASKVSVIVSEAQKRFFEALAAVDEVEDEETRRKLKTALKAIAETVAGRCG